MTFTRNLSNMKKDFKIEILLLNNIDYQLKLGNVKNLRMHFNKKNVLVISAPTLIKESSLISFIDKNIEWIKEKHQILDEKLIKYDSDSKHLFFGKTFTLKINYSKTPRVDLIDNIIIVSTNNETKVRKQILEYRYEKSQQIFEEILYQSFLKMKDDLKLYPKLIVKESSSKWGCCYFKENKIMLNIALTQVPLHLIEYVVFHELTHFIYPNHSKEFHQHLSKYIPNEKLLKKELKQYISSL